MISTELRYKATTVLSLATPLLKKILHFTSTRILLENQLF